MQTTSSAITVNRRLNRLPARVFKRGFDLVVVFLLLPALFVTALALLLLNPFLNRGPLFFVQERMGRDCRPFRAVKFRTMTEVPAIRRGPYDALEQGRITPLGRFLRRCRLDELPQVLNVLKGDMSLIGPRPDFLDHAVFYLAEVPGYRERHAVRPGISGYAQVTVGYVEGPEGVRAKVDADLWYIAHASIALDLWVAWRTAVIVFSRQGY